MPKIDEQQYQAGRRAFDAGMSLQALIERVWIDGAESDEDKTMSFATGFADALLDRLRGIVSR